MKTTSQIANLEYKFAVYSIENQFYLPTNNGLEFLSSNGYVGINLFMNHPNYIVSQFLGHDKDGIEVYTNDVLKLDDKNIIATHAIKQNKLNKAVKIGDFTTIGF